MLNRPVPATRPSRPTPSGSGSALPSSEPQPVSPPEGGAEERVVAYLRDLDQLLQRRPELAETYLPARISVEALRWAV